jgi:hypothetical protein
VLKYILLFMKVFYPTNEPANGSIVFFPVPVQFATFQLATLQLATFQLTSLQVDTITIRHLIIRHYYISPTITFHHHYISTLLHFITITFTFTLLYECRAVKGWGGGGGERVNFSSPQNDI